MTEPAKDSPPVRKFRLGRIVFALAVVFIVMVGWRAVTRHSVVGRARQIKIGQPRDEVIQQLGHPQIFSSTVGQPPTEGYSDMMALEIAVRVLVDQHLGYDTFPGMEAFPVQIEYDADRRVSRVSVRDGTE